MKRLVGGIILAVFGLLGIISAPSNRDGPGSSFLMGLVFLGGGGALIHYGMAYLKQKKMVLEFALQMLHDDNKINARELAARAGASEIDVRMHIAESQRNGIIPFKAEIV